MDNKHSNSMDAWHPRMELGSYIKGGNIVEPVYEKKTPPPPLLKESRSIDLKRSETSPSLHPAGVRFHPLP